MSARKELNIALIVEYRGQHYCGWQRQQHSPSVQQRLEQALSEVADHPVSVFCAGRTDTGVHATGQVVNFCLHNPRPLKAWMMGANNLLPDDISIRWAGEMPDSFHARHSAIARRYRYVIQNTSAPAAILNKQVLWHRRQLDEKAMHEAAQLMLGERDFSSFQAASCQSPTPMRNVHYLSVMRFNDFVIIEIQANAFLHHMVRNITGALIQIGEGRASADLIEHLMQVKDRTQAPATAPADGLYLVHVTYPEVWQMPGLPMGPLMLADKFCG